MNNDNDTDPVQRVLSLLGGVSARDPDNWIALCPAHPDNKQSLSVTRGRDGRALVRCHANCAPERVVAALGLTLGDLFPPKERPAQDASSAKRIVATYRYTDEAGELLYEVVRYQPKDFRQRRPDPDRPGAYLWKMQGVRRVPYRLPEVLAAPTTGERGEPVFVVEGEKDADNLAKLGLVATTNAGGAEKWPGDFAPHFRGARVFLLPDNDEPGRAHADAVAANLAPVAAHVAVVELPNLPPKGDVSDWLRARQKEAGLNHDDLKTELLALAGSAQRWTREGADEAARGRAEKRELPAMADGLPVIECNKRHLRDKTKDAFCALLRANDPPKLFVRSGQLVRVTTNEYDRPAIEPLNAPAFRGELARVANFVSTSDDRGKVPVSPPKDVVEDLMNLPHWPGLQPLEGIVTSPVVASDGTLVETPGYLERARLFYHEPGPQRLPSTDPTPENVEAATSLLLDTLLGDFPFLDAPSRAHALALVLSPFLRPRIAGPYPFILVDAPTPGTGKSLLVYAASAVFLPGGAIPGAAPNEEEEWRKRITSSLLQGSPYIWIDNIASRLSSGSFALALTGEQWEDRRLNTHNNLTLPVRCVWVGTGNNTQVSDEIARRTLWIRLDSGSERPWMRDPKGFKVSDLRGFVTRERPRLLAAALTLLRAWIAAGQPLRSEKVMGSFEGWCQVMGGVLDVAGVHGFLGNCDELYERLDPEREKWCQFLREWHQQLGEGAQGAGDVLELAKASDIVDDDKAGSRNWLGRKLKSHTDRVFSGYRLVKAGSKARAGQYRVLALAPVDPVPDLRGLFDATTGGPPGDADAPDYTPPDGGLLDSDGSGVYTDDLEDPFGGAD